MLFRSERGENVDHFRDEFLTYWNHATRKQGIPYCSLLGDSERTRVIQCWAAKGAVYVGDSADAVLTWLRKRFGDKPIFSETVEGLLIWCPQVLLPAQYPRKTSDVLALARQVGCDELLMKLASRDPARIPVVLGFRTDHGRDRKSVV